MRRRTRSGARFWASRDAAPHPTIRTESQIHEENYAAFRRSHPADELHRRRCCNPAPVLAAAPTLSAEERAIVSEHLLRSRPSAEEVAAALAIK